MTYRLSLAVVVGRAGALALDQAGLHGEPGQVGAAAAACLVADPVQVRADGTFADEQPGGDLRVAETLGDQRDQLTLAFGQAGCRDRGARGGRGAFTEDPASKLQYGLEGHIRSPLVGHVWARCGPSLARTASIGVV